jgi:SMI1 / KNR4 family (SUKH-1)
MNDNKIQRWASLLEVLSIDSHYQRTSSSDRFIYLEQKFNVKLPDDYQYFCQILGVGRLDDFLNIDCLDEERILQWQDTAEYMIGRINYGVQHRASVTLAAPEDSENRDDESYIDLLKSSLIFGDYNSEYVIFWDLRTYNPNDDSYDIYWYSQDIPDGDIPVKIGRDFTDFICNFCYGQLPCQLIPEMFPESPREIGYTFYCG